MGKLYVPSAARTPVDRVRDALNQAERVICDLRGAGPQAVEALHLFDQIDRELKDLEARDVDVRVERTRFETLQRQLRRRKRRFLRQASPALDEEQRRIEAPRAHWWWYLGEAAARERRRTVVRVAAGAAAVVALLVGAWLAYEEFLAPPPEVREAFQRIETGRSEVEEGNLLAALEAYNAATKLTPDDPEPWLWKGVLHDQLGEPAEAQDAFAAAEPLHDTAFDYVLNRGRVYLQAGAVGKARVDAEAAISLNPTSGWGYYLRAGTAAADGDYGAASDDLERASEQAGQSGESRLLALVAQQLAQLQRIRSIATPD